MNKTSEEIMNENYKRFSEFWEKARNIVDEDGDKILEWDKSNIANFCFIEGYKKAIEKVEKKIEELEKKARKYIHEVTGEKLRETIELDDLLELKLAIKDEITK